MDAHLPASAVVAALGALSNQTDSSEVRLVRVRVMVMVRVSVTVMDSVRGKGGMRVSVEDTVRVRVGLGFA